ncbi:MAG: tetratricopeptide repeat protein [Chitinispirillaceae bacterium]|nr:tetratricopeptide repeat protein [Chitinispirillaceae bacterium]
MIPLIKRHFRQSMIALALVIGSGQIMTSFGQGLPGEFLVTQRWQYLLSSRSALANPALINEENYISAKFAFSRVLSEFTFAEVGAVYPIDLYQTAGITWLYNGVQDYARTDALGEVFGDSISDNKNYFALNYAINPWKGLSIGANLALLSEAFDSENFLSAGFDLGLTYRVINNPFLGHHVLGLNVQNLIMYTLSELNAQEYPRTLRISLNSNYWERRVESGIEFAYKDLGVSPSEFIDNTAAASWDLNARVGGWIFRIATVNAILGMSNEGLECVGFSVGANFPSMNNGRDLSASFQFLNVLNEGVKDYNAPSWTVYLKGDFGKHREEVYARKMAKLSSMKPNDLYVKGVELYNQGNYWDAFFIFSELLVEYPDFFKNDWVSFFIGSCQEEMDMRITAEEGYRITKEKYDRSAAIPFADLGLMRVHYRDNNFHLVERQFNELNKLGVPDSLKYHAYYIMGQAEMNQGNNAKAKQLFDLIPETHPDYVYAQHSAAVSDATGGDIESAISRLENCIQAPTTTNGQKEIVYRSYVFLGYMFYEDLTKQEGPLAKAVTALRSVPKESYHYPDALVGLGWTALKARQWPDCMAAGQELMNTAPSIVLKAEGALLQAYAHMMQKDYPQAVSLLNDASQDLEQFTGPDEAGYSAKQSSYESDRTSYTQIARSAFDLGTARQSGFVQKQIDSLHTHQKDFKGKLDEYLKFADNYKRTSMFSKNVEKLKEDINYALAKGERWMSQNKMYEKVKETKNVTDDIDKELEELRKEEERLKKKSGGSDEVDSTDTPE